MEDPINLYDFCKRSEYASSLYRDPFIIGDNTYATNGHLILCLENFHANDNHPSYEQAKRVLGATSFEKDPDNFDELDFKKSSFIFSLGSLFDFLDFEIKKVNLHVNGVQFNPFYVELFSFMDNVKFRVDNFQNKPCMNLIFDGGHGVIMAMISRNEGLIT